MDGSVAVERSSDRFSPLSTSQTEMTVGGHNMGHDDDKSEGMLSEFDSELYEDYYPYQKEQKLLKILKDAKETGNEEASQQVLWELGLLNKTVSIRPDIDIPDRWKWCEENIFKPLPFWDEEAVPYFRKRTETCRNRLHLARYYYFLWVFERRIDDITESASLFLETGNKYVENQWFSKPLGPTPFLYRFALRTWKSLNMKNELKKGLQTTLSALETEFSDGDRRWPLELAKILVTFARYLEENQIAELSELVNECVANHKTNGNYHLARSYLRELATLYGNLKKETERKASMKRVAELLELEAEGHSDSDLVRVSFLIDAMRMYAEIGEKREKDRLKETISSIDVTKELKEIRTELKLDFKRFDTHVDDLIETYDGDKILCIFAKDDSFLPSLEDAKRRVEQLKEDPLQFLLSQTIVNEYGDRIDISGEENLKELKVKEQIVLDGQVNQIYVSRLLDRMKQVGKLDAEVFERFMVNCQFPYESIPIIKEAFLDYRDSRYASAIALMIPQVEVLTRAICQKCEIPVLSIRESGLQTTMLNSLLSHAEAKSVLGEDLAFYLKCFLVDPMSTNVRNLVCHGNLNYKGYSRDLADSILYIIVRLGVTLRDKSLATEDNRSDEAIPRADELDLE